MSEWKETEIGLIPSDWHIDKLENHIQQKRGITYGIVKVGDFVPGGIPVIRGGDIRDGKIVFDDQKRVTEEVSNQFCRTILQGGEVLLNLIAEPGHAAIVPHELIGSNVSRDVAVIPLDDSVDHQFICYFLRSEASITWLTNRLQGSVTKKINLGVLRELPILLISLDEQRWIADFLECLDCKIENLRKQNETLEAIAQTVFNHWFVDFEFPNEDGKPYKSSGGEMVRSDLGEIPAGWRVGKSGDLISLQGGFAFKSQDFQDLGDHGIIKIKNISDHVVDINQTDFISASTAQKIDPKFKINSGDVLIAMTGAEVAKMGVIPKTLKSLWLNQRVGLFREILPGGKLFIYYLFIRESSQKLLRDRGSGSSAQPNISATDIESIVLIKPSENILSLFDEIAQPLFQKNCNNLQQIETLTKARDVLLPQLMSGKLRITK